MEDSHAPKHLRQLARQLSEFVAIIHVMLWNLDKITLTYHLEKEDAPERIAEDFLMVASDVLPRVDAPAEQLTLTGNILADWAVLADLVLLMGLTGPTGRRLDTAAHVLDRIATALVILKDTAPELIRPKED